VTEDPGEAGDRAVNRHRTVASPYDILSLLAETAFLRAGVPLIPHSGPTPDPARPLKGICNAGILPPVNKQADRGAFLAGFPGIIEPFCHPMGPRPLVLVIPVKIWKGIFRFHAAVFL